MTGYGSPPIGRKTSARSTTPSSIVMGASQSICIPSRTSENIAHPIPYVVDADGQVVDLAVMKTAFLAREDFEGFLFRAHRLEAFLRERERDLLVPFAVNQEEGALKLLHDSVELESLQLLQRCRWAFDAEDPLQVLGRDR